MDTSAASLARLIAFAGLATVPLAPQAGARAADPGNCHADVTAALDSKSATRLRQTWMVATRGPVTHRPLIENDRVYFADWSGAVTCADAKTGTSLWCKQVAEPNTDAQWFGFCGTGALGSGLLFEASAEGDVFAFDTQNGETKWKAKLAPDERSSGNHGAILHHEGLVYVGSSSIEQGLRAKVASCRPTFQGRVVAFEASTGAKAWELPLVDDLGSGAAVTGGFAIDPATHALFFTTGNDTKLSESVVAVDAKTGAPRWSTQLTGRDIWTMKRSDLPDQAYATGPQLFDASIDGKTRKLVGAAQRSGFYCAFDSETGQVVWQTAVGCGQIGGAIMADASVGEGRVLVWSSSARAAGDMAGDKASITIKALDAANGAMLWTVSHVQTAGAAAAGFLSKDVYFIPAFDGHLHGYRTSTGEKIWTSAEEAAPLGSSLTVVGSSLYVGRGVPKLFGGNDLEGSGMCCFATENASPPIELGQRNE